MALKSFDPSQPTTKQLSELNYFIESSVSYSHKEIHNDLFIQSATQRHCSC